VYARGTAISPTDSSPTSFDFEAFFHAHYPRIARAVARIAGDHGRAEDLAIEAFWKLSREPRAQNENPGGWVYRTAMRMALNELRRAHRRARYELLASFLPGLRTPEELHAATEEAAQVRLVLAVLPARQAELLLLRFDGLSYEELASTLDLNPASIGTLLSRAQRAFRKEFVKRYGTSR
jgi:RNA polymerase sigma-70 factor (ECF subfamily)